ncbi:tyrosine-type recombinase/integrase [Actinoplanes siamensis]|uniref:Integrase n=1 Tax=Actinoplanes siamensis TaxID=1223317 RepID=A0A919N550_9ACTN|nr:tyrosine-type recombinase/integrase [Actinoplanes siamensis]GIF04571.1 integrase [Actinoplanes siamensis]
MQDATPDPIRDYLRYREDGGGGHKPLGESSLKHYEGILRRMDYGLDAGILESTTDEIRSWICKPNRDKATRSNYITIVRGYVRWAAAEGWIDFDATARLPRIQPPKGRPNPWPEDALRDIRRRAKMPWLLAIDLASYEGARCVEISRLDRQDVTETTTRLFGKGDKYRDVPTHPHVWARVKDMPPGPLVIAPRTKRRATPQQISHGVRWELKRLGYPGFHNHMGRHRFATKVHETSGGDLRVAQELLGHSSVATTQIYVGIGSGRLASAVAALD